MAEVGLFWLLLPLAALSGWYFKGRSMRHSKRRRDQFTTNYFRGLNYLLNEQPDKAIEVFMKIAEVDSNTVETHLALGSLFRRRGEVDRAIGVHQNLISRAGLSSGQRTQALLELGEDYMRAGLLDRAEKLFTELIEIEAHTPSALRHLIAIYQQEKDWTQSIEHAKRLERVSGKDMSPVIAQFYCEIAAEALENDRVDVARSDLMRALRTDAKCVRASLMQGQIEFDAGDYDKAIKALQRVEDQDLDYVPEVLEPLMESFQAAGRQDDCEAYLRHIITKYRGISPVLALAEQIEQREGRKPAAEFMGQQLKIRPSVRGLDYLIGLNLSESEGDARENLLILRELTSRLLQGKAIYRCNNCGFGARSHHWQCPSCKLWNSVKPIHGVSGE
ncbi:MAG: lipopolysaccharide assembly protein LapB [Candidatus Competibacterales bacterium]|nr:lipopolysaccharide assembly protein LapB [Candidatus Competibacterales bacterium]